MKSFLSLWVSQMLKESSARCSFFHEALKYIRPAFVPIAEDISRTVKRTSLVRNKVLYLTSRSYSIVSMFVLIRQMQRLWRPRTPHVSMISLFSNSWLGSLELDLDFIKRSQFGIWTGPPCRKSSKLSGRVWKQRVGKNMRILEMCQKRGPCVYHFSHFSKLFSTSFTYYAQHRHVFFWFSVSSSYRLCKFWSVVNPESEPRLKWDTRTCNRYLTREVRRNKCVNTQKNVKNMSGQQKFRNSGMKLRQSDERPIEPSSISFHPIFRSGHRSWTIC